MCIRGIMRPDGAHADFSRIGDAIPALSTVRRACALLMDGLSLQLLIGELFILTAV